MIPDHGKAGCRHPARPLLKIIHCLFLRLLGLIVVCFPGLCIRLYSKSLLGLDALDLAPLAYVLGSARVSDRTDLDVVLGLLPEALELV